MDIIQLENKLKNFDISLTNREICRIIGMAEESYSRKKKLRTDLKRNDIEKIENKFNITLTNLDANIPKNIISLEPLNVSCGTGVINLDIDYMQFDTKSKYAYCLCNGDSMKPTLNNGDLLIIQLQDYIDKQNAIYAFTYEDEQYCKYLSKDLNTLIISSENKKYLDLRLVADDLSKVRVIGRVIGSIRKF